MNLKNTASAVFFCVNFTKTGSFFVDYYLLLQ